MCGVTLNARGVVAGQAKAADPARHPSRAGRVDVGHHHVRAFGSVAPCAGGADAARAAGNDHDLAFQPLHPRHLNSSRNSARVAV